MIYWNLCRGSNNDIGSPFPIAIQQYEVETEASDQFGSEERNPIIPSSYQVTEVAYLTLPRVVEGLSIEEGLIYTSPDDFKQEVTCFAMANNFAFEYLNNSRSYYKIICKVTN